MSYDVSLALLTYPVVNRLPDDSVLAKIIDDVSVYGLDVSEYANDVLSPSCPSIVLEELLPF